MPTSSGPDLRELAITHVTLAQGLSRASMLTTLPWDPLDPVDLLNPEMSSETSIFDDLSIDFDFACRATPLESHPSSSGGVWGDYALRKYVILLVETAHSLLVVFKKGKVRILGAERSQAPAPGAPHWETSSCVSWNDWHHNILLRKHNGIFREAIQISPSKK